MNTVLFRAALGTGFIFLMTTLGAAAVFIPPRRGGTNSLLYGLTAGIMLAAAVWSLILPALERAGDVSALPCWLVAAVGIVAGAVFVRGLGGLSDRLLKLSRRSDAMLFIAITLHNIPEGMAVGLAFALAADGEATAAACALALGIGIQNIPEGASVSLPLADGGMRKGRAFTLSVLSGAVEPLAGMLAVVAAGTITALMPWLLCFSAGAMLYVTVEELLPLSVCKHGTAAFLFGFVLMMALDVALG